MTGNQIPPYYSPSVYDSHYSREHTRKWGKEKKKYCLKEIYFKGTQQSFYVVELLTF